MAMRWFALARCGVGTATLALVLQACASTAGPVVRSSRPVQRADSLAMAGERGLDTAELGSLSVTPFRTASTDPTITALGFALAELLTTDLARSARLTLVERGRLDAVLRELDLAKSGRVDSASAPRVGQLIGARRLILGGVDTMPGGALRLAVRLADVQTGAVADVVDATAPLRDVLAAEKAVAFRLFDALGVTLSPAERALIDTRPTSSLAALVAYGRGLEAELAGDRDRARQEFQRSLSVDPAFRNPRERLEQARALARTDAPGLLPGLRQVNHAVAETVDRLNRPLDSVTSLSRPTPGPSDPSFPSTVVTVVITVRRP
jgi:TolB-like protein